MKCFQQLVIVEALLLGGVASFAPTAQLRGPDFTAAGASDALRSPSIRVASPFSAEKHDSIKDVTSNNKDDLLNSTNDSRRSSVVLPTAILLLALFLTPETALAAATTTNTAPVPNALVAYGHYLFILIVTGLLMYERFTIAPGMTKETEKSLVIVDASYGISAALLFVTGYLRAVEYGKGFDFYAHEPLFWLKLSFAGILAGLSLFPTITFVKRGSKIFKDEAVEPMSEALASRMKKILNAEISAILSIPLLATLMARGVGYMDEFPWQAGAALTVLSIGGSGFVYAKQALTWTEDDAAKMDSE